MVAENSCPGRPEPGG